MDKFRRNLLIATVALLSIIAVALVGILVRQGPGKLSPWLGGRPRYERLGSPLRGQMPIGPREKLDQSEAVKPGIPLFLVSVKKAPEITDQDLTQIASRYDLIIDTMTNYSNDQIGRLRLANPQIKILRYFNSGGVFPSSPTYKEMNPDWFLKDSGGQKIGGDFGARLDPGNQQWRDWLAKHSSRLITQKDYDGVALDVVSAKTPSFNPINPKTGGVYTDDEWRDAEYGKIKAVRDTIGSKLLFVNGVDNGFTYYSNNGSYILDLVDGVAAESFVRGANYPLDIYRPVNQWKMDLDMLIELESKGKTALPSVKFKEALITSRPAQDQNQMYGLATYLLARGDNSSYMSGVLSNSGLGSSDLMFYYEVWSTDIGAPQGGYYEKDGTYRRDFSKGKVLVNPTTESHTVQLGATYRTPDGESVESLDVLPHTGVLLTK